MDQGGSEADTAITQQIRKAVVAQDNLSTDAKNVKIITRDGVVTLRGPVASAKEKTARLWRICIPYEWGGDSDNRGMWVPASSTRRGLGQQGPARSAMNPAKSRANRTGSV